MLAGIIIFSILAVFAGAVSIYSAATGDGVSKVSIISAIVHGVFLIADTVCLCLNTARTSFAAGVLFTVIACIFLLVQVVIGEDRREASLTALSLAAANAVCAFAGYMNVYAFMALGASFAVISVLLIITFFILIFGYSYKFSEGGSILVTNIIFAVIGVSIAVMGVVISVEMTSAARVQSQCAVYEYDNENSVIGEEREELNYSEYYALQLDFKWSSLISYSTSSEQVEIKVTFPAPILRYISEGAAFEKSDTDGTVWTCKIELNSKSNKHLKSGYFIFRYSYADISIPVPPVNVHVNAVRDEGEPADNVLIEYDQNYSFVFKKKNYDFGADNVVKDLSYADDGYYKVIPPVGCSYLKIRILDREKTGEYYSETTTYFADYYLLDIPFILQNYISESVYESLYEKGETLVVEITAVGNDDYEDTSYEFLFTVKE